MQVLGRVAARAANHNAVAVLFPLEHRAWTDAQPFADLGRH